MAYVPRTTRHIRKQLGSVAFSPQRAPHFSPPNFQKNSMIMLPMKNEDRDSSENRIVTKTSNDMTPLAEGFAPGRLDRRPFGFREILLRKRSVMRVLATPSLSLGL
jgi:hypothetical protein